MFQSVRQLLALLSLRERRTFYAVLVLILVTSLVEMVGVASILPFLAVLANPGVIETNAMLATLYGRLGFSSERAFLAFLGFAVLGFILFSLAARLVTTFALARFSNMRAYSLASQIMENYLRQPYTWFLDRNSAALGKVLLIEVDRVVTGALIPALRLIGAIAVCLSLLGLLLAVEPTVALIAAALFGGSYALIFVLARRSLARLGEIVQKANYDRFRTVNEATQGIKDVKVLGLEPAFLIRFRTPARSMARAKSIAAVIADAPRYLLESIAIGGTLVLVLVMIERGNASLTTVLPTLGVFAFAGLRMFPALQSVYRELSALKMTASTVDEIYREVAGTQGGATSWPQPGTDTALGLRAQLVLEGIGYSYPAAERQAISDIELTIPARSTVGIVGGTGAGKTTLVDVMLGLLWPQAGRLVVDGVPVTPDTLRAWQRSIGYVPQQIFLTDDTVAGNIAFGLLPEAIDMAAVERAARIAELHDFIMADLPRGYATTVGDRGVRLSGGQRQRIGIARALYHDPDVLILDEATSALDNLTEKAVMDAVQNLGQAKTVVMIAHRLSTVRNCDLIVMMEGGRITASGTYEELLGKSQKFRAMAALAS
jgi:ABC-type multidrug transport system fused ATPase/permease subunit